MTLTWPTASRPRAAGVNGAVNWTLRYADTPQDMAGTASRTLLGVQIQCAQCHDHKTEKWKQTDFQAFAAAFTRTRFVPLDGGKPMGQVKRIEVRDLDRPAPRFSAQDGHGGRRRPDHQGAAHGSRRHEPG